MDFKYIHRGVLLKTGDTVYNDRGSPYLFVAATNEIVIVCTTTDNPNHPTKIFTYPKTAMLTRKEFRLKRIDDLKAKISKTQAEIDVIVNAMAEEEEPDSEYF